MNKFISLLFLLNSSSLFAQKTNENYAPIQYKSSTCISSFQKIHLTGEVNAKNIQQFLKATIANLKDYRTGLKLNYINESPGGFHYSFHQTFNDIKIYQTEIKVNVDRANNIRSLFDNSENTSGWNLNTSNANNSSVIALRKETNEPVLTERAIENNSTEILRSNGEIIFERDMNSYANQDSVVSGKIFNPDPLTSAQQSYGCPFCDNNDSTNSSLNAQLQTVNFTTTFTGLQFILENKFVRVADFDAPTVAPVTSATPQFYFDRSQSGFEDVNAFYHITTMQQHIQSLGFACADSLAEIDTHAVGGADNSYFSPVSNPHRIYYGTGGVDDAEDADVLVHEYGHSVSETAAPNSNSGQQRNSLDEGFCDYMAGAYSKSISTFNDNWMFNWDGHNEFWNGRVLNSTWVYPTDLTNSIYHNAQIWSAVLFSINGDIGRAATDSLILQTHYAYAANISMADAALLLMQADTLLTGGKYACPIYNRLFEHGLNPLNPFINCGVGILEEEVLPVQFLSNSNSFSLVNPNGEKIHLQVLSITGQLIFSADESQHLYNYENENLSSGIYLVNVQLNGRTKTFRWSKI